MKYDFEIVINGIPEYEEIEAETLQEAEAIASTLVGNYVTWSVQPSRLETPADTKALLKAA